MILITQILCQTYFIHNLRASTAPPQRKILGAPVLPNDRGQDGFSSNQLHSLTKILLKDIIYSPAENKPVYTNWCTWHAVKSGRDTDQ